MNSINECIECLQCESCGELDTINLGDDAGYCTECYAVENYITVYVDPDTDEIFEEKKY